MVCASLLCRLPDVTAFNLCPPLVLFPHFCLPTAAEGLTPCSVAFPPAASQPLRLDIKVSPVNFDPPFHIISYTNPTLTSRFLHVQRQFLQRSDRVKGVDLHPSEPWC